MADEQKVDLALAKLEAIRDGLGAWLHLMSFEDIFALAADGLTRLEEGNYEGVKMVLEGIREEAQDAIELAKPVSITDTQDCDWEE